MKRSVWLILCVVILILASSLLSQAGGRVYFRGGVWIGPGWWGPHGYPYYYPYYYTQPPVIQQQAPAYIQPDQQQEEPNY